MPGINEIVPMKERVGMREASSALGSEAVFVLRLPSVSTPVMESVLEPVC